MRMRRSLRGLAYAVSLLVLAAGVWGPASVMAQAIPSGGGGGGGVSAGSNTAWTGTNSFIDANLTILDDGDNTKIAKFQASTISTGTTRTFTFPNFDGILATTNQQETWIASKGMSTGVGLYLGTVAGAGFGRVILQTANTPNTSALETGTTSNSYSVLEQGDHASDFNNGSCGTATCTHPQLSIFPNAVSTTQYNSQAYWGNAGRATKTLTESSATSAFQVSIASGAGTGGIVDFTVFAADASDQQTLTGVLQFSGVNKAGTETCPTPTLTGTALNAVSTGTLTCSYAADTTPTNACNIQFNCVSSLTQTTLEVYYRVNLVGPGQVTPQ